MVTKLLIFVIVGTVFSAGCGDHNKEERVKSPNSEKLWLFGNGKEITSFSIGYAIKNESSEGEFSFEAFIVDKVEDVREGVSELKAIRYLGETHSASPKCPKTHAAKL